MKRPISIILLLTVLIALSACNSNVSIHQPSKSPSIETSSDPYEKGMFEDVTYIRIVTNAHEDAPYAYNIIIDSPEAIERFVDDIRPIEKAKQVELKGERFKDYALEDIEPVNISWLPNDEGNLDITLVSVVLRYSDGRLPCRIREFTDYYPDVFDDGDGIKITYDKKAAFLENKDRIIINKIIPMIKDVLPYVQLYDESGNYLQTVFLSPLDVKTADYRIECPELYHAFYYDYWADYIAKHDFEIYDNGKSVTSLPEPDESVSEENAEIHNVKLLDKSGNTYQYDYDRKEIPFSKCLPDQQDDHKYHCD